MTANIEELCKYAPIIVQGAYGAIGGGALGGLLAGGISGSS
ncbi:MAG: hypothetical protein N3E38_02455 [Candidatus Aenigmarchaeota archaeon]|nr:hypothetical protein [Candidatus Aenigmarchaeota archaeon]